jgi:hypothetical protein
MEPRVLGDLAWAPVGDACVQAEARDEQKRGWEQQDEEPVGERTREQPTPDRRISLDNDECHIERGVFGASCLDALPESSPSLNPTHKAARDRRLDVDPDFRPVRPFGGFRVSQGTQTERSRPAAPRRTGR